MMHQKNRARMGKPDAGQTASLKRMIGYILKNYKFSCVAVVGGIFISVLTTLCATLFMQRLIDDYILPNKRFRIMGLWRRP